MLGPIGPEGTLGSGPAVPGPRHGKASTVPRHRCGAGCSGAEFAGFYCPDRPGQEPAQPAGDGAGWSHDKVTLAEAGRIGRLWPPVDGRLRGGSRPLPRVRCRCFGPADPHQFHAPSAGAYAGRVVLAVARESGSTERAPGAGGIEHAGCCSCPGAGRTEGRLTPIY